MPVPRSPISKIAAFPRPLGLGLAILALGAAAAGLGGCYQRVVRAKGLGADRYNVSEPYQESSVVDDWLFGPTEQRRSNNTRLDD